MRVINSQKLLIAVFLIIFPWLSFAAKYGARLSIPIVATSPDPTHGYQMMLTYHPETLVWHQFRIAFDGGYSHLWTNTTEYKNINIYSVSPIIQYQFMRHPFIKPYVELSIGLSYLNRTHFDHRNLGIHMAFQDRVGLGALLGEAEHLSLGLHALHYSNAHLSEHNSGITVPLVFDVGYQF